jgi:AcrR family transcriptional regulator
MNATALRQTAEERREAVLDVAMDQFSRTGFEGTSTETIARQVGISQPYLFRLFGTKKELFLAAVERCFEDTLDLFRMAARGAGTPDEALARIGNAYSEVIADRRRLRLQMQAYAACDDPDVRALVRRGFGSIVSEVLDTTQIPNARLADFLGRGMLMNVLASMDVLNEEEGWAAAVREGCQDKT